MNESKHTCTCMKKRKDRPLWSSRVLVSFSHMMQEIVLFGCNQLGVSPSRDPCVPYLTLCIL